MDETKKKKPEEEQEKSQGSVDGEENTQSEKNKGSDEKPADENGEGAKADEKPADENGEGAKADEKPNEEIEKLKAENLQLRTKLEALSVGFKTECLDDAVVLAENIVKRDGKDISQALQAVAKITWSRKIRNNCRHLHSRKFRQIIHQP